MASEISAENQGMEINLSNVEGLSLNFSEEWI